MNGPGGRGFAHPLCKSTAASEGVPEVFPERVKRSDTHGADTASKERFTLFHDLVAQANEVIA